MTWAVVRRWASAACLAAAACVATSSDVDALRGSINDLRTATVQSDSARQVQMDRAMASVAALDDSVRALSARVAKMKGDVQGDLYTISQQLLQIQELTGQSQRRLQEMRASLEQRQVERSSPPASGGAGALSGTAAAGGAAAAAASSQAANGAAPAVPGPNELYQLSLDQLRRGSAATARNGLQLLVATYPQSELVPDAQFYIGEAYAAEGNASAAETAYATVVAKYPASPRAPTALYKRALALEKRGNLTAARAALNQLVQAYPRSDEAALAKERLRAMN